MPPKAKAVVVASRRIQVSVYDRASSLLLALLLTIGLVAVVLFILWLSNKIHVTQVAVDAEYIEVSEDGEGGGDGRPAGGSQLDTPSDEPFVGKDNETTDIQDNLSVLGAAVSSKAIELDDPEFVQPKRQGSFGSGGGIYGGFGDGRGMGHGPGKPGWPRHWEVTFSNATLDLYAKQLQYFGIELAVLQPGNKIIYVYNLTKPKPSVRVESNPALTEKRYYLTWRTGDMQKADRELMARAGVDPEGHLILQFLPKSTEGELIKLERGFRGATPKEIRKTRFGVKPAGDGYEFYVMEQSLRR